MIKKLVSKIFQGGYTSAITACVTVIGVGILGGCLSKTFDGPELLGGEMVRAETLNLGHDTYMQYCMQCHGMTGDGNGPAAYGSNPMPRNFKQGVFKFGNIVSGDLPTDEDLKHTIRYGLRGTPMLPWDISDERLNAVVQYIKTFSPVWRTRKAGAPIEKTADPFGPARATEAIALGKKVFHGVGQCYSCHPSYSSLAEINAASQELTGNPTLSIREHSELSIPQDSSYFNDVAGKVTHKYMPPDYTKSWIKTGGGIPEIYQVLGAGVGGTTMASWKGVLSSNADEALRKKESDERLWALAYYVNSLSKLKFDTEGRKKFFDELNAKRAADSKSATTAPKSEPKTASN